MSSPGSLPPRNTGSTASEDAFRWQGLFQRCRDPLILLNRRRTILFVNHAWEALTGVKLAEARGLVCRRRREPPLDGLELLLHALAPPAEAAAGQPTRVRRLISGSAAGPRWWDLHFFPLAGPQGLLGMLCRITPAALDHAPGSFALPERLVALREHHRQAYTLANLESELPALRRVLEQVRLAGQTAAPVLLVGEPGTGKEWVARTIHQQSPQCERAFAALDSGRLPPEALAALLFGPAGASQRAHLGTLYFKDPEHLPREFQARLLDLVEAAGAAETDASMPPRVMAGCATDPASEVQAGRLLPELHFALSTLTITLPPLRERHSDWPLLVERLLARLSADSERAVTGLAPETWDLLRAYSWPGNLRELHAVVADACGRAKGTCIEPGDLPWHLRNPAAPLERPMPLDTLLEQVERRLILLALRKAKNNKSRAAELLSIWRPRLLRRMEALGIGGQGSEQRGQGSGVRGQESEDETPSPDDIDQLPPDS
jgi:transcriptional regulator with AAA-type ATPase domain